MCLQLLLAMSFGVCPQCVGPIAVLDAGSAGGIDLPALLADSDGLAHYVVPRQDSQNCWPLYYARTTDQGLSWDLPTRIDLDPSYQRCDVTAPTAIASDGGERLYVAMVARADGTGTPTIVVQTSPDRGASWPGSFVPVAPLRRSGDQYHQILAASGGKAWSLWLDEDAPSDDHVFMSATQDGGLTWSLPSRVDAGLATPIFSFFSFRGPDGVLLALLVTNEGVRRNRLYFLRSEDDGKTWSVPVTIDDLTVPVTVGGLGRLLTFPDGQLLATWTDNRAGSPDVWSRVSLDGGRTWTSPVVRVDTGDPAGASESGAPHVAHSGPGHEVVAAWLDIRGALWRVFANDSADGGLSWGGPSSRDAYPLSVSSSDARPGSMDIMGHSSGRAIVAWTDAGYESLARCGRTPCPALYLAESCDGGQAWEPWRRVVDNDGSGSVTFVPFPGGAADLTYQRYFPSVHFVRIDGSTVATPRGVSTYCVGSDPPVDGLAVSAGCPGGLTRQWYVDGVAVPGANGPSYQPALAAGDHRVEVRGTCLADPGCMVGSIAAELHARAPQAPADVGNHLLAVRQGSDLVLDWDGAPSVPDAHAHVRRAVGVSQPWSLVAPDPLTSRNWRDSPAAGPPLYLYDVRQADVCEAESAN